MSNQANIERLAKVFAEELRSEIGDEAVLEANKKNLQDPDNCATHEYTDPNEVMMEAFNEVFDRHPLLPFDSEEFGGFASAEEVNADLDLFNNAWALAKKNNFYLV